KEDAVRMKECMAQMEDAATDVDARLVAADDLSMLVESLDNANDLRPLGLWPRLFALLRGAPEAELRSAIAFVIATAVANNERSQTDLVDAGGFPVLVDAFERETDDDVLVRVLSCFAQVVQHHEKAFTLLIE
ncbi:Fes1-domain-containing protein, partial [Caulochytrium protostelioides]